MLPGHATESQGEGLGTSETTTTTLRESAWQSQYWRGNVARGVQCRLERSELDWQPCKLDRTRPELALGHQSGRWYVVSGHRDKYMDRQANSAVIPTLQIYVLFIVNLLNI